MQNIFALYHDHRINQNKFGVNLSWLHAAKLALGNVNIKFEDYALFYLQYIAPQSTVHM
jgi:hypothetical protein